jgi:hypothetical protein
MVRPRQSRPPSGRPAAVLIATAALVLVAAACGGSPSSTGAGGSPSAGKATSSPSAVAYSRCMRSHGVPDFPDPSRSGIPKVSPRQLGVASSRWQAAQSACAQLLRPTQHQARQILTGMLNFARCMRSHGVPNWPDYTLRGGTPLFDLHGTAIAPNSPLIVAKQRACSSLLHLSGSPPTSGGARSGSGD